MSTVTTRPHGGWPLLAVAALLAASCAGRGGAETDEATAPADEGASAQPAVAFPDPDWDPIDPVDAGIDPAALDELVAAAEESG